MTNAVVSLEGAVVTSAGYPLLAGLDLVVEPQTLTVATGANGAGKTSLLRALCGLLHLEAGRVTWGGNDVRDDLSAFHASLAYLGHEPPLKAELTACENLRYWVGLRRRLRPPQIASTLERVGAPGLDDRLVRTLSAGQRRRVALAGVLLLAAPLWLLDEPTTHLDVAGQQLVGQLLEQHVRAGGLAVTAVHHEIAVSPERLRRLELSRNLELSRG